MELMFQKLIRPTFSKWYSPKTYLGTLHWLWKRLQGRLEAIFWNLRKSQFSKSETLLIDSKIIFTYFQHVLHIIRLQIWWGYGFSLKFLKSVIFLICGWIMVIFRVWSNLAFPGQKWSNEALMSSQDTPGGILYEFQPSVIQFSKIQFLVLIY